MLEELQGNVTDLISEAIIAHDIPALDAESIVHDNGCGYGAFTIAAMATKPATGLKIHATDINPMFMAQMQTTLDKNPSWPVKMENQDACALKFPDNTFTHSASMFIFAGSNNDIAAAKEIWRTLKRGGTGIVAVWKNMPWHVALENAHRKVRSADVPMAPHLSVAATYTQRLPIVAKEANWKDIKYVEKIAWVSLGTNLRRLVTIAWSFLGTSVGGRQQSDEEKWDEAIYTVIQGIEQSENYKLENGVHKLRMVAEVAIFRK